MILPKIFQVILTMSFLGTITALVILLVKKIFKNKISPIWHYIIWFILLIKLILPYGPASNISIFNLFNSNQPDTKEIHSPITINHSSIESSNSKEKINVLKQKNLKDSLSLKNYSQKMIFSEDNLAILNTLVNQEDYLPFISEDAPGKHNIQFFNIISIIWLTGVCISGIYIIWVQLSCVLKIKKLSLCRQNKINILLENCKETMKVNKKIPLLLDSQINTPSLMGVIKPKIIIPPDCIDLLTTEELKYVFMHELAHYKQKDILIRWVMVILQIIYWFNPILWFAFIKIRQDSETACDTRVLTYIKADDFNKYGKTMLKMLDFFSGSYYQHGMAGILNKKKILMERVQNIVNFKKRYFIWSIVGIILFSSLSIVLLTNARVLPQEVIKIKYQAEEFANKTGMGILTKIEVLSNNNLISYDNKYQHFIMIDNEGNKEYINCEGLPENGVYLFTVDSNDQIYVFIEKTNPALYVYNLKGKKIKEIKLDLKDINTAENNRVYYWDMEVDSKGNIYILIPDINTQIFDSAGKYIKSIDTRNNYSLIELDNKDNLYTIGWKDKVIIKKQNPLTSKTFWQYKDNNNLSKIEKVYYISGDNSLYLLTKESIFNFNLQNQSLKKTVYLNALLNDKKHNNFLLKDFAVNKDNVIYLCGFNKENDKGSILRLTTKKTQVNEDIKTLTISVQALKPTLEYAINKFENKHPDIVINIDNYNAFSWIMGDMTYEEIIQATKETDQKKYNYVQKLNAQMLTGKGPDIIQMNGIPYRKYAEKDLLLNLNKLMNEDPSFNKKHYYTNIFKALEYKNNLFVMPVSFAWPALLTNAKFLNEQSIKINDNKWTWNDFIKIAHQVTRDTNGNGEKDVYGLPTIARENIFKYLYNTSDKSFIDYEAKKAYFTSKEFIDLLKLCNSIANKKIMNPDITEFNARQGGIVFYPEPIHDFTIFLSHALINAQQTNFYNYPCSNNNKWNFNVGGIYGINSRTKYKKEAWEFIKFLISEEVQNYKKLYQIPVNKKARAKKIKDSLTSAEQMMNRHGELYAYPVSSTELIKEQIKNNLNKLNEIIPKLNTCNINNIQIKQIITEEIERFFNRKQTAEKTAQIIQRKVEMYFYE